MRSLVFLVAVTYCSAQLAPIAILPSTRIITNVEGEEVQALPLPTQYVNPYFTPYNYPLATPYLNPYGYSITPDATLKPTEFPFIYEEAKPAAEEARRRRRRDVKPIEVPLPYIHAVPAVAKATVETKELEKVDAATPADTTKLALTTKQREYNIPAVKYVRPVVTYEPRTYTAISPAVHPYQYGIPSLGYPFAPAPIVKVAE